MQTVITGATGLLGGNLAVQLLAEGHGVRATRRSGSRVTHLGKHPIEWVEADLDDTDALTRAFEGAEVVYHCAALVSPRRRVTPALEHANVGGTRRVLDAVRAAGVRRLVHCSTVGAVGVSEDGQPCTEDAPWNFTAHGLDDGYVVTKSRAEDSVREAVRGGLDAVIVNPTYMLGPYDVKPSSGRMIVSIVRGELPGWTPGKNNFVDVRDVARGMVRAAELGRSGERYILGGSNLSYREVFELIARAAGVRAPRRRVPYAPGLVFGLMGDLQEWLRPGSEPFINSATLRWGFAEGFVFSSARAERELGYRHGPLEPAISDALAWFREHGVLARD